MPNKPKHSRKVQTAEFADFIERATGEVQIRVEEALGDGFVRLRVAEAEARQAKHDIRKVEDIVIELLRNARDAQAKHIYLASSKNDFGLRTLTVIDDGDGVPERMQTAIFEPRVTSKLDTMVMDEWGVHGRGMALYSIAANANSAKVLSSCPQGGTALQVVVDTAKLKERSDQSTLPKLVRDGEGKWSCAASPHNIARQVLEFALAAPAPLKVYLGSPAQIAASLLAWGEREANRQELLFCKDLAQLPLTLRLAATNDAADFAGQAGRLGLDISERTAYRVLQGEIAPLQDILVQQKPKAKPNSVDIFKDARGLKLSAEDQERFGYALERAFAPLADRYYVSLKGQPKISVKGERITVRFDIDKQ
ncbi:MAG: ATP-binding protein [Coriobacteriales bacterium]|jgi:hypothetical protein|nr:ATP-binding protein [Coriobacteriales bacterium]